MSCKCHVNDCQFFKDKCCYCNNHKPLQQIYIDNYGFIEPTIYGISIPIDIFYCAGCHETNMNYKDFTKKIIGMLIKNKKIK
jgi:hypothetical protein